MTAALVLGLLAAAPVEVAHRRVLAHDGTSLGLYRYGTPGLKAVLLIPELGFNHRVFDMEGEGLAPFLAEHGRTVYVAELRTKGLAERLGDLSAVLDVTGPVDLVAHGYGGTLAMAANEPRIGRVVAIATPVELEVPSDVALSVLRDGKLSARAFELLFAMNGRFRRGRLEALRATALTPLDGAGLLQWMRSGDLALPDGTTVRGRLERYDRPTLLFVGLADGFANPELCTPLPQVSKADVQLRTFSRFELAHEDYSHLSLLQGENARSDVYEPALRFLEP
jgi:pimeloyl-ACP methyl ester carboxylesterase